MTGSVLFLKIHHNFLNNLHSKNAGFLQRQSVKSVSKTT
jgi:hypothetical protein